jgi:Family of unknown function (DUF5760)
MSQPNAARIETVDTANTVTHPTAPTTNADVTDLTTLPTLIKSWKTLIDETKDLKEQIREKSKRLKAMEEMILQSMKRNNIGALDLRNSGGRILYRRKSSKETLGPKNLGKLLAEHLKSETKAAEILKYLDEHRGTKTKESIEYEAE